MGVATAIIGGAVIAAGATVVGAKIAEGGANKQADAMTAAGNATAQAARDQLAFNEKWAQIQMQERRRVEQQGIDLALQYGKKSPEELASINRLLQTKESGMQASMKALEREWSIYDTMDATVKEAGKQQLSLLQGQSAKILDPLLNQRIKQKAQLEAQLASKLGPGFRTSSAGIEALSKFDDGTSIMMASAQSEALTQVSNIVTQSANSRPNMLGQTQSIFQQAAAIDQSVASAEQNATARLMQGVLAGFKQTPVDLGGVFGASQGVTNSAGAPFAGAAQAGQNQTNLGGQLMGAGAGLGGNLMSGFMFQNMFQQPAAATTAAAGATNFGSISGVNAPGPVF